MMGGFLGNKKAVSPVIAIVLLLMMTVAAAGAAYFWLTRMQSRMQESSRKQITEIMEGTSTRVIAQATICKIPVDNGLIGYWNFYEGSGNTAHDLTENQNNGILHPGPEDITSTNWMWTSGRLGNGVRFDGNDSYVEIPYDPAFDSIGNKDKITVAVWVNYSHFNRRYATVDRRYGSGNGQFFLSNWFDSRWRLYLYNETGQHTDFRWGDPVAKEWFHIAFTFDGSTLKGYENGDLLNQMAWENIPQSTLNISVGALAPSDNRPVNGTVDELRIYDRALSQSEIQKLYKLNGTRRVEITVYNAGTQDIGKAEWIANLKREGTTVESDTYDAPGLESNERITLKFYFEKMRPDKEYTISLEGVQTSTTVSC